MEKDKWLNAIKAEKSFKDFLKSGFPPDAIIRFLPDGTPPFYLTNVLPKTVAPDCPWCYNTDILKREEKKVDKEIYEVVVTDRAVAWYQKGELNRKDGPAIEYKNGRKEWYRHNRIHREDGPAIITEHGSQIWVKRGHRHRLDGPAVINKDGFVEWWIDGNKLTRDEFVRRTSPVKEMTVAEIEAALGFRVKVVK